MNELRCPSLFLYNTTSGQLVPKSIRAVLIVLFSFFYAAYIENIVKLRYHTLYIVRAEITVFHSPNDIATTSAVAPLLI